MTNESKTIGWQPIETAPEDVRRYGPDHAPVIGGCLVQVMSTEDGVVALRFGQSEGSRDCPLKYWMLLPEEPE